METECGWLRERAHGRTEKSCEQPRHGPGSTGSELNSKSIPNLLGGCRDLSSERQTQPELHPPRTHARRRNPAEIRVGHGQISRPELRVVPRVERLPPE